MRIRVFNLICLALVSVIFASCGDSANKDSPMNTFSPLTGSVWTGRMVCQDGDQSTEYLLNLGLYPLEKTDMVVVYTKSKYDIMTEKRHGIPTADEELSFRANGCFSCTIYKKTEDGGLGEKIFQEDEGFCFYSGNALHLMSKYEYKRPGGFRYWLNGVWSITSSSPTSLRLKHQDTFSEIKLVPLK